MFAVGFDSGIADDEFYILWYNSYIGKFKEMAKTFGNGFNSKHILICKFLL